MLTTTLTYRPKRVLAINNGKSNYYKKTSSYQVSILMPRPINSTQAKMRIWLTKGSCCKINISWDRLMRQFRPFMKGLPPLLDRKHNRSQARMQSVAQGWLIYSLTKFLLRACRNSIPACPRFTLLVLLQTGWQKEELLIVAVAVNVPAILLSQC